MDGCLESRFEMSGFYSFRVHAKDAVKDGVARCWTTLGMAQRRRGIYAPVLCYHSVTPKRDVMIDPMAPILFEAHMAHVKANYVPVTLEAVFNALDGGDVLPDRAVAVTFDDGYSDNYDFAFPLLRKYSIPATIFLVSGFIEGQVSMGGEPDWGPLSWDQIREMMDSGQITFGSHTHTHAILSSLDDSKVREEVRRSKEILEEKLRIPVKTFAYPNGRGRDIPRVAVDEIKRLGFVGACSTIWGTRHEADDRYLLNRVNVPGNNSVDVLERKIAGAYDYLHYLHRADAILAGRFGSVGVEAVPTRQRAGLTD
jgi:peptidoglycan/xylan/chitin deacetylase (PgdA/CDA1 family)